MRFVENPIQMRIVPLRFAAKHVRETTREIRNMSERRAPVNTTGWRRPGPRLKDTIRDTVRVTSATKVKGEVGSNVRHAHVAHDGAVPHMIYPRDRTGLLKFYWTKQGKWAVFPHVSHPGMSGVPYLTIPLLIVGTRKGFRVVLYPR